MMAYSDAGEPMPKYDTATTRFMDEVKEETLPTRDPYPRPIPPQSPDATPGNTAATYPEGGSGHKVAEQQPDEHPSVGMGTRTLLRSASKLMSGGDPKAVIAKAIVSKGIQALAKEPESGKTADVHEGGEAAFMNESKLAAVERALALSQVKPLDIYNRLNELYGEQWHDWEPETILRTLDIDTGIELGGEGMDLIGALQLAVNTNQAHQEWHVFEKVGHAFNMGIVDFAMVQPLRPDEASLTIKVLNKLRKDESFNREVVIYVAACGKHSGMVCVPEGLFPMHSSITVQQALDEMGNDLGLAASVGQKWSSKTTSSINNTEDIQLKGLQEVTEYVKEKL
jgi:hypothetical protein